MEVDQIVPNWHSIALGVEYLLAAVTFVVLLYVVAPYGRHERPGWGPTVPAALGWMIMEMPAVVLFAAIFFSGPNRFATVPLILLCLWQFHYLNRTLVFPLRMRTGDKRMPVVIMGLAICFNVLNTFVNAGWIGHLGTYTNDWIYDPRFIFGATLFLLGWLGNTHSDSVLRKLRRPGKSEYGIPRGGLYRWVSAPNYLCEIVEWIGWAMATWSFAGLAFAVYTAANLVPRALSHHEWYKDRFTDYPIERKAIIPYLL